MGTEQPRIAHKRPLRGLILGKRTKDPLEQRDHEFLQSHGQAVRTSSSGEMVAGRDVELRGNEPCEVARSMPLAQLRFEVEREKGVE